MTAQAPKKKRKFLKPALWALAAAALLAAFTAIQIAVTKDGPVPWWWPKAWAIWFWNSPNDHALACITALMSATGLVLGLVALVPSTGLRETKEELIRAGEENTETLLAAIEGRISNAERQTFQARIAALEAEHEVSFPLIRALLASLGAAQLPDDRLLAEFEVQAKAVVQMLDEARLPSNVPEIAAARAAIQAALDQGDRDRADRAYARAAETLAETRKMASLEEAEMYRGRARVALSRLDRLAAADHFAKAAELADPFDADAASDARWKEAQACYDHALLFGGLGPIRRAAAVWTLLAGAAQDEVRRADLQNAVGLALRVLGQRAGGAEGPAALNQAVEAYRAAQRVHTEADMPANWAATQNNLGIAFQALGERAGGAEGLAALNQAVEAYRAALRVRTKADMPADWAATQDNLGIALGVLGRLAGGAEGLAALNQAVDAYRAALRVRTEADRPADWAATQNNLGTAFQALGERAGGAEGLAALNQAVEAYRAALRVRTEADMPANWAATQYNLGIAFQALGERAGGAEGLASLKQAVEAHRAALRVRTEADMPAAWARTQNNLDLALRALGERTGGAEGPSA